MPAQQTAESTPWILAHSQVSPRSQSSSRAGNYLYQQSTRHFSRCSALNMALNLLTSSQAKYMPWVKFVPGAVLGHSSHSACAVPIDRGWHKVSWQPVPVPLRSLPALGQSRTKLVDKGMREYPTIKNCSHLTPNVVLSAAGSFSFIAKALKVPTRQRALSFQRQTIHYKILPVLHIHAYVF